MPKLSLRTRSSVLALVLLVSAPLDGGSLKPYPLLGAITMARLAISGPTGFEPIPGLDRTGLEQEMRTRCVEAMRLAGIELGEPDEASILVAVRHTWHDQKRELVALLITLEVHVPAQPADPARRDLMSGRPTLRLWSVEYLELGPSTEAREIILEALDAGLQRLLDDRESALSEVNKSS